MTATQHSLERLAVDGFTALNALLNIQRETCNGEYFSVPCISHKTLSDDHVYPHFMPAALEPYVKKGLVEKVVIKGSGTSQVIGYRVKHDRISEVRKILAENL